eukprot:351676-Chlamydomonas_euryale.AAC.2
MAAVLAAPTSHLGEAWPTFSARCSSRLVPVLSAARRSDTRPELTASSSGCARRPPRIMSCVMARASRSGRRPGGMPHVAWHRAFAGSIRRYDAATRPQSQCVGTTSSRPLSNRSSAAVASTAHCAGTVVSDAPSTSSTSSVRSHDAMTSRRKSSDGACPPSWKLTQQMSAHAGTVGGEHE